MADDLTRIADDDTPSESAAVDRDVAALLAGYDHRNLGSSLIYLGVTLDSERYPDRHRDLALMLLRMAIRLASGFHLDTATVDGLARQVLAMLPAPGTYDA
jgi:hypothetical protein